VSMQAHSAPLGITFYNWKPSEERPVECGGSGAFPKEMDGYAFIAFHGSWNRNIPTGYKVVYVAMDNNGNAIGETVDLLAHVPPNAPWEDGFRPVDVDFDDCGRLVVTSDGAAPERSGSKVVRIEYDCEVTDAAAGTSSLSPTSQACSVTDALTGTGTSSLSPSSAPAPCSSPACSGDNSTTSGWPSYHFLLLLGTTVAALLFGAELV
jgi:hypothetical protein